MKNILKISLFFTLCRFLPEWFTLGCHVSFLSTVSRQAVILKPLMLGGCILQFWKPPILINLVPTHQGHICILKIHPKYSFIIFVYVAAGYIIFCESVNSFVNFKGLLLVNLVNVTKSSFYSAPGLTAS